MSLTAELNLTRKIGAEYEMAVPLVGVGTGRDVQQTLANVLTANGIRAIARGYDHSLLEDSIDVAVETDSSVQGESRYEGVHWFPVEVKTRILNGIADWERIVPKTLEICRYMGARVNTSTGHHLHLSFDEIRERATVIRSLYNVLHRFDPVLFGLVAPSRRQNHYCRPLPAGNAKLLHGCRHLACFKRALSSMDRYYGLNMTHLWGTGPRIEFRYHHGTLEPIKARHWLRFCLQLVQHAVTRNCQSGEQLPNDRKSFDRLLVSCGFKVNTKVYSAVSRELRETGRYMLRRWKSFNGATALPRTSRNPTGTTNESEA